MSFCLLGQAQIIDFPYVDSVTYHHYENKKWEAVIANGKIGLENGIDYYYLRMRIGEAYYAMGKYALAIPHFEEALEFSVGDKMASEYLYYSLLNLGKTDQAYRLGRSFNPFLQQSLNIKRKPVAEADVFGGYIFSNNENKNGELTLLHGQDDFGQQTLIGNQVYMHAGLKFRITPSFSLYVSGSFLNITRTNRFEYKLTEQVKGTPVDAPDGWIVNRFYEKNVIRDQSFEGQIRQNEYYANGKIQLADGWAVNLFGNFITIKAPVIDHYTYSVLKTDTLAWQPVTGAVQTTMWVEDTMVFIEKDTSLVNWVGGINLEKDFNIVTLNVFGTISRLTENLQGQAGLSLFYYPLGNTLFYGKTELTVFFEPGEIYGKQSRLIFYQMLGIKLFKNTWLEGEYLTGNIHNVNIKQGLLVYNLPEKINHLLGVNLHIYIAKHLELSVIYSYSNKEGFFKSEKLNSSEDNKETYNSFTYQTQNIIGGIKWTF